MECEFVTCRKCGKEKPRSDFKEYTFIRNRTGKPYKNITPCYECRAKARKDRYKVDKSKKKKRTRLRPPDPFYFVFSSDIIDWCKDKDFRRYNRIYRDKKEREELRHPFANI